MARARVLTVAGSDPSGGAGLQADLGVFAAFGCHALGVVAGLTVQSSAGVHAVLAVAPGFVAAQLEALFADCPPAAAKTGMLADVDAVRAVAAVFSAWPRVPLVVDPVAASADGVALASIEARHALLAELIAAAALVTPNSVEAEAMTGLAVTSVEGAVAAARRLVEMGAQAALVKGGHLCGDSVIDVLVRRQSGVTPQFYERPRVVLERRVHGTGCALSAAIASGLARGLPLPEAVRVAGDWVHAAIAKSYPIGAGACSLDRSVRVKGMPA